MDLDVLFGTMLLGAPVVLIGTALIYLPVWLTGRRKGRTKTRNLAICLLAAYAILVWFATLGLELFLGFGLRPADWEWWYLLNLRPFDWLFGRRAGPPDGRKSRPGSCSVSCS